MKLLSTFSYTDCGGRDKNEDCCGIKSIGENLILVAADGLGGHGDGQAASSLATAQLLLCGSDGTFPTEQEVYAAFDTANAAICTNQTNSRHMKTTAVYLCLHQSRAIWAHIGDSRLYHFFNGKIVEYTLDHSVSQMAVLLGEISHEQIPGHADRSRLLRALGCEQIEPTVRSPIRLEKGRHDFLLCTDGFWEYVPEAYMEQALAENADAAAWGKAMRTYLNTHCRPDHDNYTALAACLLV